MRLTPPAEDDVKDIRAWYKQHGGELAADFRHALDACLERVSKNPFAHPMVYGEIRRALLNRFPYCVFYVVDDIEVIVIGVFHAHRDPKVWQSRY